MNKSPHCQRCGTTDPTLFRKDKGKKTCYPCVKIIQKEKYKNGEIPKKPTIDSFSKKFEEQEKRLYRIGEVTFNHFEGLLKGITSTIRDKFYNKKEVEKLLKSRDDKILALEKKLDTSIKHSEILEKRLNESDRRFSSIERKLDELDKAIDALPDHFSSKIDDFTTKLSKQADDLFVPKSTYDSYITGLNKDYNILAELLKKYMTTTDSQQTNINALINDMKAFAGEVTIIKNQLRK